MRRGYNISVGPDSPTAQNCYEFICNEGELRVLSVLDGWAYFLTRQKQLAVMQCPSGPLQRFELKVVEGILSTAKTKQALPPWAKPCGFDELLPIVLSEAERPDGLSMTIEASAAAPVVDIMEALKRSLSDKRGLKSFCTTPDVVRPMRPITTIRAERNTLIGTNESGAVSWRVPFVTDVSSLMDFDGGIYAADSHHVRYIDGTSGAVEWVRRIEDEISAPLIWDFIYVWNGTEDVDVHVVLVGPEQGYVFWLDCATGEERGRVQLAGRVSRITWPAYAGLIVETVSPLA